MNSQAKLHFTIQRSSKRNNLKKKDMKFNLQQENNAKQIGLESHTIAIHHSLLWEMLKFPTNHPQEPKHPNQFNTS